MTVKPKVCPVCRSANCEESSKPLKPAFQRLYLGTGKKLVCWLCYSCGAGGTKRA